MENNDQAWVAPQNEDMEMEDDEDDEEEEEHDDSEDDDEEDEDEVAPLPDVLGLNDFNVFDAGIADDEIEQSEKPKPREKATEADIVRVSNNLVLS